MKPHSNSLAASTGGSGTGERTTALMVCLGFFVIHGAAVLTRPVNSFEYNFLSRIWGINNVSYYSIPVIIAFYAILFLICLPSVNRLLVNFFHRMSTLTEEKNLFSTTIKKMLWILVLGIVSLGVFRLFHIKYNFLGDMDIRVNQTVNQEYGYTEFATMWGLHQVYDQLHRWFGMSGLQVFQWSSALFGVIFVWIAFFLAVELGKNTFQRWVIFLFTIAGGGLQFFFGYAEIYPFPALTVMLFVYTGVLCTKYKVPPVVPLLAFVLAVSAHLLSIVFLPSILFLLLSRRPKILEILRRMSMRHLALLILLTIPAAYVILPLFNQGYYLMPWSQPLGSPNTTTLLSSVHIWEFLNSQLLAAGGGFVLFIIVAIRMLRSKQSLDTTNWFLALAASFTFLSAFITNTVRGSGDWDILAFPAIVYIVWTVSSYLYQARSKTEISKTHAILVVILVFNLLSTATWIGINASDRSIKKIEDMLVGDPGNYYQQTLPVAMSLAFNYEASGLQEKALQYFRISAERYPQDPRAYFNYATRLIAVKQDSLATPYLEYLVSNFPTYPRSYEVLIPVYAQQKNYQALSRVIERLFGYYLQNPGYFRSVIPSKDLVNWFSYLIQIESANKNEKAVQMIQQQISLLR